MISQLMNLPGHMGKTKRSGSTNCLYRLELMPNLPNNSLAVILSYLNQASRDPSKSNQGKASGTADTLSKFVTFQYENNK
jgi:hypothetical protein